MRVLLLKPFQPIDFWLAAPPLGILSLAASLRRAMLDVDVQVVDMNVRGLGLDWLRYALESYKPHVVGVSALNFQLTAARQIAVHVKRYDDTILTVLGGPATQRRSAELLQATAFDWIFEGEAELAFPQALEAYRRGVAPDSVLGLSYRTATGFVLCQAEGRNAQLDDLPLPAWDLCDFDLYAKQPNGNLVKKYSRYAYLFTSRGCPYRCAYCHDVFGKKYHAVTPDRVLQEIDLLYSRYDVREFHIVDDIFNFDRARMSEILRRVRERYRNKLAFCFPNGLRADILTPELIKLMAEAGTISIAVAIETASQRLQRLMSKHLQIEKAMAAIECAAAYGIVVKGFFMLGFPTETEQEMEDTVSLALRSQLTLAHFFAVTPQPGSKLYELALQEQADVPFSEQYNSAMPWYQQAYHFPLGDFIRRAYRRFYLRPKVMLRIMRWLPWRSYVHAIPVAMRRLLGLKTSLPAPKWYKFTPIKAGPFNPNFCNSFRGETTAMPAEGLTSR